MVKEIITRLMEVKMEEKFRKITVTDGEGNVKNIQDYKHNEHGDPIYFKKTVGDKIATEIIYTYEYDEKFRKTMMKMYDKVDNKTTILHYEY